MGGPEKQPSLSSYYNNMVNSPSVLQALSIFKIDQVVDEMIKATWEDAVEEDSAEEKLRKLNERNFWTRIQTHVKDALPLAALL